MKVFSDIFSTVSIQPVLGTVIQWVCILGFFAFCIIGLFTKIRDVESREGIWYCKELKMQISLTDPSNTFMMIDGERIQCRCEMYYVKHTQGILEVYSNEWEHPGYKHGKTVFAAEVQTYSEMSMVVQHRKTKKEYTFVRTDKVG